MCLLSDALREDMRCWYRNEESSSAGFEALTNSLLSAQTGSQRTRRLEDQVNNARKTLSVVMGVARAADTHLLARPKQYVNIFLAISRQAGEWEASLEQILLFHRNGRLAWARDGGRLHWQTL